MYFSFFIQYFPWKFWWATFWSISLEGEVNTFWTSLSIKIMPFLLILFQLGSGITLTPGGGGALSARISSKCYKTAKRLLSTQNLFPYKYFDI